MTDQPAFTFPATPRARNTDPQSSHEAAERVAPHISGQWREIYETVAAHPGRTNEELAAYCSLTYAQIARRTGEMARHGWLKRVDRAKKPAIWFVREGK